jgi:hypothetical protein
LLKNNADFGNPRVHLRPGWIKPKGDPVHGAYAPCPINGLHRKRGGHRRHLGKLCTGRKSTTSK